MGQCLWLFNEGFSNNFQFGFHKATKYETMGSSSTRRLLQSTYQQIKTKTNEALAANEGQPDFLLIIVDANSLNAMENRHEMQV